VVEIAQPENFQVVRQANQVPCDGAGSCTSAIFQGARAVQSVPYSPLSPAVCVIPREMLIGAVGLQ
jgi:hypothetical protein